MLIKSDLIKSAEVHGAPVDAAAELADVDHVAMAGHAHLLHQLGAHRVTRAKLTRRSNRAQFARILKLELKKMERMSINRMENDLYSTYKEFQITFGHFSASFNV